MNKVSSARALLCLLFYWNVFLPFKKTYLDISAILFIFFLFFRANIILIDQTHYYI